MKLRLVILLIGFGIVLFSVIRNTPKADVGHESPPEQEAELGGDDGDPRGPDREQFFLLSDLDLAGVTPAEQPVFTVSVEVRDTDGKDRLYFEITENHGFFVETIALAVYHTTEGEATGRRQLVCNHYINDCLKAGETLKSCMELVQREILRVGGSIGTSANWKAEVAHYNRVRTANPDRTWEGYRLMDDSRLDVCR